jgi:hypothetical protein
MMRNQPLPLDPFGLARFGVATWVTNVLVAQKIAEAFTEQTTLARAALHGDPLVRSGEVMFH